jgi:hypothetical protein
MQLYRGPEYIQGPPEQSQQLEHHKPDPLPPSCSVIDTTHTKGFTLIFLNLNGLDTFSFPVM